MRKFETIALIFQKGFKSKTIAPPVLLGLFLFGSLVTAVDALAAIPLITDDSGTQGKGKFQVELFGEYSEDREEGVTSKETALSATFTYGVIDQLDIAVSVPYQFLRAEDDEGMEKADGFSDVAIEAKWRFFEKNRALPCRQETRIRTSATEGPPIISISSPQRN